ncbi:MAG: BBE domain-containing protein [Anaerolineae bacterium]|nr:BBE domain-containing protein [Anaerolineae bacterium]
MSADSVLYFDVITADGRMLRVSESENSDLFWGMRGGGGGFAIVTAMCIRLYPVTTVYGGSLIYPAAQAKEVFQFYRDWILWLPAEWTTSIAIMNFPPIPEVPEMLRGQSVVMVNGCYCGDAAVGRMMLQSWLDWTPAIANTFHPMPFSEVSVISNDPLDPMPGLSSGGWLADLDNETIDLLIQYGVPQEGPAPLVKVEVRQTGGAISNVNASANAFSHRESPLVLSLIGVTPTPEIHQQVSAYVAALKGALEAHMTGIYPNFVEGHEAHNRTQDAFAAEKLERLTALKTKYDPENLFRFGYKITPKQGMLN